MDILFVSDYVCPYCLVAKEAMKAAIAELDFTPRITWHPYELTIEPAPRVDTYNDQVRKSHYQVLVEPCRQLGLDMKLPPNVVPRPYTRLAFEGYYYALEHGRGDAYNNLVYRAYFIDEEDIGQADVLKRLAGQAGLDPEDFGEALENGIYSDQVAADNRHAREELHVGHVPTIFIDGKEISVESYTKKAFLEVFRNVEKYEASGAGEGKAQGGCGPDGCSLGGGAKAQGGCGPDGCSFGDEEEAQGGCGPDGCSF